MFKHMELATGKRRINTVAEGSSSTDRYLVDRLAHKPSACSMTDKYRGRWLDALTIALGHASEGKWYVSTLELRLTSFDACVACRSVRLLRVTIHKRTPLSLWGVDDCFRDSLKGHDKRQMPRLRAAGVVWTLPTHLLAPTLSGAGLLKETRWMQVVGADEKDHYVQTAPTCYYSDGFHLTMTPPGHSPTPLLKPVLASLKMGINTTSTMPSPRDISWPPALRQLSFGFAKDERIDFKAIPRCLERLALGGYFTQTIKSVSWPVTMKQLTLGGRFNGSIVDVVWPASLVKLSLGNWFDQPITQVVWPAALQQLTFGDSFNQSIADVTWPTSSLKLSFGHMFDKPIAHVAWPASLLQLAFGDNFDQPLAEVTWPASANGLVFGDKFDQPIDHVSWPSDLQSLEFGANFDQPIEHVVWPSSLVRLTVSDMFEQATAAVVLSRNLQRLTLKNKHFQPVGDRSDWPPGMDTFDHPEIYGGGPGGW